MPLPSKQKMIYSYLLKMFQGNMSSDGRLPSEVELATQIGVARRTLRYTLSRLESEGLLIRTNHGTFLRKNFLKRENPITVLVPCPDYQTASGYWSSYLIHQMILGAVKTAVKAGTYAVTLPITMTNDPNDFSMSQFQHLNRESRILVCGLDWFPALSRILSECHCRCGIISHSAAPVQLFIEQGTPLCNYYNDDRACLKKAVRQLAEDGARRIVYFGRDSIAISKTGKRHFMEACAELNLECSENSFVLFPKSLSYHQILSQLRGLYRKTRFDGLFFNIFDSITYHQLPHGLDFFRETGIPRKTKMILEFGDLLKCPDLPENTRVLYRPQREMSIKLAEFVLSNEQGQFSCKYEYEFPLLKDFLDWEKSKTAFNYVL